jgi:hypothetical protein
MPDYRAYAFNAAVQNGLNPPDYFVNQINQESGFNPNAYNAGSDASGIAQIVPRWHPGVDVWNPYQSLDYAAKLVAENIATYGSWSKALIAYNWGPGNMANDWDGTFADLPAETQHYLQIILGQDQINKDLGGGVVDTIRNFPDVPDDIIKQQNDWECSVRTSYAALWLVNTIMGRPSTPSYPEFSRGMVPKYADPDVGLKDGTGAGLAEYLRSWGLDCFNVATLSRQACVDYVKQGKLVCIGGHSWYHWALAVGYEI